MKVWNKYYYNEDNASDRSPEVVRGAKSAEYDENMGDWNCYKTLDPLLAQSQDCW